MIIKCPICGERDMREFHYLGSDKLLDRPTVIDPRNPENDDDQARFHDYLHIRDNVEGANGELWSHEFGCRAWLQVVRDTRTHDILSVNLAAKGGDHE